MLKKKLTLLLKNKTQTIVPHTNRTGFTTHVLHTMLVLTQGGPALGIAVPPTRFLSKPQGVCERMPRTCFAPMKLRHAYMGPSQRPILSGKHLLRGVHVVFGHRELMYCPFSLHRLRSQWCLAHCRVFFWSRVDHMAREQKLFLRIV